jgi:putative peptidoglycan lipid II flippase
MVRNFINKSKDLLFKKQGGILSAATVLMVTYTTSMALGILRERVLVANYYHCCRELLDVYYAAFRLPDMAFQLIVIGALSASFLPVFSQLLAKDEDLAYQVSSSLINILLFLYLILAGIIFVFAKQFSALITGGFTLAQIELMASLTRTMLLAQGFFLISNFLTAILQSHQRFIVSALAPLFYNLGIILATVLLAPLLGIWAPTIGVVVGAFFHLIIQVPLAIKLGFVYHLILNFKLPQVKEIFRLMIPRTLGLAIYQLEATMAVFFATSLPAGSLTIFHLAQKLMDLPVRLFGTSIGQAALPALSSQTARGELETFKKTFISSLSQILYFSFPAMAAVLVLRVPLVRIAYGSGAFPWEATLVTGRTVALISLAIFSQSATQLIVRGFYALHDTKIPLLVGAICVATNIGFSLFLTFGLSWGVLGLASATSISSFLEAVLLFGFLQKKTRGIISLSVIKNWGKMVLATFIAAVFFWMTMRILDLFVFDTTRTINLLILTLIASTLGFLAYFLWTRILDLKEAESVGEILKKMSQLRKNFFPPQEIIDDSTSPN